MNKIVAKAGMAVGIFLGVAIVAYAITNLFFFKERYHFFHSERNIPI